MRKNRNTTSPEIKRFGFFDILVIFLCLLGAAGTLSFFWKEFNRTQVKLNEEPVGMVTYRNRTAHRRFEERVIWDRLREASPVYNGDTVRLADLSGAVITFIDGSTSIDLSENTLVQIFYSGGGTRIDLSGGGLVVNSGGTGKVLVSSGENAVSLSGGSAGINSDDLGFGLSVTEGEASVNGTIVESGAVRSFTKDGTVDTAPLIAVTSLESAVRILNYGDSAPVNFSWNSANFSPDTMVVVEVALDRAFKNIVERRQVQGENSVIISLENGSYWWHAYPSENGAIRTVKDRFLTSGRIDVAPSVPAFPLEPADGREFSFSGESRVILSWTAMEEVSRYLLELADNAAMINPVVSRQIEGSSFLVKGLEEGIWYWRVTPVFSARIKGDSAPSAVREFSVARSEIPPVPEPAVPAENAEIDISGEKITLSWTWDSAAASWKFEAADNPEMKNPLAAEIVYSNFYSLVPGRLKLVPGSNYYWRVSALSEDGVSSAPSPVRSFIAVTEPGTARLTRNAARSGQSPAESGQPSAEALFKDGDFLPAGMENPPENENPETGAVTAAETTALAEVRPDPSSAVIEASVPASPEQAAGAETAKPPLPVEDLGEGIVTVAGSTITLRHSFTTQNNTDLAVTGGKTFIVPRGMTLDLASGGIILEDNTVFNVEGIVNVTSSFTYIPTLRIASAISMPARITGNGIIHLVQRGELLNISHANKLILENITLDGLTTATKDPRGNDYPAGIGGDHTDNNTVLVTVGGELEMRGTATITGNTYYKPSGGFGGSGMYVSGAGRVTMNGRSQITGNTLSSDYGADGGGVYVGGVLVMNDQSSITGNLLRTGKDWAGGGGVRVSGGSLIMNDEARIANNTASCGGGWASGGGVHVAPSISATLTMNGGIIEGNRVSAVNRGGAQLEVDNATARYGDGKNIIRRSSANGIDSVNNTIKGRR